MATSSKDSNGLYRPVCWFTLQLLTSFLISVVLNSHEIHGRRLVPVNVLPGLDENDISSSILPEETYPTPSLINTSSEVTPMQTTLVVTTPDPHEPYMKGMTSQLGEYDLEFTLDYYAEKNVVKEYDFDSVNLVKKLADSAIAHNTPPNLFMEEIQDLISLQNRSRSEATEITVRDEVSQLNSGIVSENLLKRMAEGWKNELKRLEKKYNVSSECTGPDSITPTRLALMFPHYLNFGQKPFAVSPAISLHLSDYYTTTTTTTTESSRCGYGYRHDRYGNCERIHETLFNGRSSSSIEDYKVPAILKRVEFGGLIPLRSAFGNERSDTLIALHLYALYGDEQNDVIPFRTKCVILRKAMQRNVLSDERRIRFLKNNDIYDATGYNLKSSITLAYQHLPNEFRSKIDWRIFDFSNTSVNRK